ncbi:MAG: Maf family protein [Gammaproteobacteria bacterium]|nr:Maf family protein [Gammaproteobacteria bacterium]
MKLILGSASKGRREVLEKAGYDFEVMSADIDEKSIRFDDPKKLVLALANAKLAALLPKIKEPAIVITSDQVVFCHGQIFEKPTSLEEAKNFLDYFVQYPAQTFTSVVVKNTQTGKKVEGVDVCTVRLKPISKKMLEDLIREGKFFSYHYAGGFQIETSDNQLNPYVEKLEGSIDSVKGLPLNLLKKLLNQVG